MWLTGIMVVRGNEDTGINCHPHISKGESQRQQVNAMNKTEYVLFVDGGTKIQQNMLFVSVPVCWTAWQWWVNKNMLIQAGKGENILRSE